MAPHTRFKLATIRTMRCDFCNKSNVDGLQECTACSMHICRECVETGKLNNDERHHMQQDAIESLNWNRAPRHRRATHRRTTTTVSESASSGVLSTQERHQAKAERRLNRHSDHGIGTHTESAPPPRRLLPRTQQDVETLPSSDFNVFASDHEHASHVHGHGHFQPVLTGPGYPPGYTPSFPNHATPHGVPSFGPGQHSQPHIQGGLAMPLGPMYGHHFSINPGLPPRGDPRIHTPPGQQFTPGSYPVPNSYGGYHGGQSMAYSPAPTPPGFAGPMFHQHVSQPPAVYNDRGYVPHSHMPTGQPGPGPVYFTGPPYGGGIFPHAAFPSQEQSRALKQEGERTQGAGASDHADSARGVRARAPTPPEHAEQPVGPSSIEQKHHHQQQQQQKWDREQAQQAWRQQQAWQQWEHQQAEQRLQHLRQQLQRQTMQQSAQPVAEYQESQERDQGKIQPTVEQASETAQQAQKQNEKRQDQPGEQQSQQQSVRPIPEGGAVSEPSPIAAAHTNAPPFTLPPITAPTITAPPVTASSIQEAQAPGPDSVLPLPTLEPDPNVQLSRLHLGEAYSTIPSVVAHVQRPFGIPALARDLYAGRPNHYDETAARWAQFQSVHARRPSQVDDEEYNDETESETGGATGNGKGTDTGRPHPGRTSDQPPSRGRKRTFSQTSSAVDSTLSTELDQPFAAATAVVPGTEALRRKLRDDADIARERRSSGERAALDMAAAANTLQGGGRGLGGVGDAQVVANDREIQRRQQDLDRTQSGREEGAVEVLKEKKHRRGGDRRNDGEGRGCAVGQSGSSVGPSAGLDA